MTRVVRPAARRSSACCTARSDSASSALVASSSSRIGGLRRMARAMAMPLALAAGEPHALLAEEGVEALRQRDRGTPPAAAPRRRRGPRRRSPRGGRSGCCPGIGARRSPGPARPGRCGGASRPDRRRRCPRRRAARGRIADRRSAAAAGTPWSCRRRTGPTSATVSPGVTPARNRAAPAGPAGRDRRR